MALKLDAARNLLPHDSTAAEALLHDLKADAQAIAARLVLSEKTVRNHVSSIFSKLQVADRAEAIIRAREAGLGR